MPKSDAVSTHGSTGVGIAGFEPTASASQMLPSTSDLYSEILLIRRIVKDFVGSRPIGTAQFLKLFFLLQ